MSIYINTEYWREHSFKGSLMLNVIENCTGCFEIVLFDEFCRHSEVLSKLVSFNIISFVVFETLHNLVSMQLSLFENN